MGCNWIFFCSWLNPLICFSKKVKLNDFWINFGESRLFPLMKVLSQFILLFTCFGVKVCVWVFNVVCICF